MGTAVAAAWKWTNQELGQEALETQLLFIPQWISISNMPQEANRRLGELAKAIAEENKSNPEAYLRRLSKERSDLQGLPFLMGKDCTLPAGQSKNLARARARSAPYWPKPRGKCSLKKVAPGRRQCIRPTRKRRITCPLPAAPAPGGPDGATSGPWSASARQGIHHQGPKCPRLEANPHCGKSGLPLADGEAIAKAQGRRSRKRWSIGPCSIRTRRLASVMEALHERPGRVPRALMKALRYPWPPVVRHAAQAITHLNLKELAPDLAALLDQPDPNLPFAVAAENGKQKYLVRELVRINHHRNCMLCHAPVGVASREDTRLLGDTPVGPVPSAQESLPPSTSSVYYAFRSGVTVVRRRHLSAAGFLLAAASGRSRQMARAAAFRFPRPHAQLTRKNRHIVSWPLPSRSITSPLPTLETLTGRSAASASRGLEEGPGYSGSGAEDCCTLEVHAVICRVRTEMTLY